MHAARSPALASPGSVSPGLASPQTHGTRHVTAAVPAAAGASPGAVPVLPPAMSPTSGGSLLFPVAVHAHGTAPPTPVPLPSSTAQGDAPAVGGGGPAGVEAQGAARPPSAAPLPRSSVAASASPRMALPPLSPCQLLPLGSPPRPLASSAAAAAVHPRRGLQHHTSFADGIALGEHALIASTTAATAAAPAAAAPLPTARALLLHSSPSASPPPHLPPGDGGFAKRDDKGTSPADAETVASARERHTLLPMLSPIVLVPAHEIPGAARGIAAINGSGGEDDRGGKEVAAPGRPNRCHGPSASPGTSPVTAGFTTSIAQVTPKADLFAIDPAHRTALPSPPRPPPLRPRALAAALPVRGGAICVPATAAPSGVPDPELLGMGSTAIAADMLAPPAVASPPPPSTPPPPPKLPVAALTLVPPLTCADGTGVGFPPTTSSAAGPSAAVGMPTGGLGPSRSLSAHHHELVDIPHPTTPGVPAAGVVGFVPCASPESPSLSPPHPRAIAAPRASPPPLPLPPLVTTTPAHASTPVTQVLPRSPSTFAAVVATALANLRPPSHARETPTDGPRSSPTAPLLIPPPPMGAVPVPAARAAAVRASKPAAGEAAVSRRHRPLPNAPASASVKESQMCVIAERRHLHHRHHHQQHRQHAGQHHQNHLRHHTSRRLASGRACSQAHLAHMHAKQLQSQHRQQKMPQPSRPSSTSRSATATTNTAHTTSLSGDWLGTGGDEVPFNAGGPSCATAASNDSPSSHPSSTTSSVSITPTTSTATTHSGTTSTDDSGCEPLATCSALDTEMNGTKDDGAPAAGAARVVAEAGASEGGETAWSATGHWGRAKLPRSGLKGS